MFMSRLQVRQFPLPPAARPLRAPVSVERYPGISALWRQASMRHAGDPVFGVEALVVHVARSSATDEALAMMQAGRASWHWAIPAPSELQHGRFIWSLLPESRAARHLPARLSHPAVAGGKAGLNHASLAVLVAADPFHPGAPPSRWQTSALAQLVRNLWVRYPNLATVVCRSVLDPETPPSALDWDMLRQFVTGSSEDDLPAAVARATPLVLLDPPGRVEPALRAT